MAERLDEIGFGGLKLYQDDQCFCYGIDAVLLADFAKANKGDNILDLCSGNGIVSFIAAALYFPQHIDAVEILEKSAFLGRKSAQINGFDKLVEVHNIDLKTADKSLKKGSYDLVTCNPPYTEKGAGNVNDFSDLEIARHESTASLDDIFRISSLMLKPKGKLSMVHRPSRLADLIDLARKYNLEPKELRMVVPRKGEAPNIVLINYVKGAGKELKIYPELVVRNQTGEYTEEINKIYRR